MSEGVGKNGGEGGIGRNGRIGWKMSDRVEKRARKEWRCRKE